MTFQRVFFSAVALCILFVHAAVASDCTSPPGYGGCWGRMMRAVDRWNYDPTIGECQEFTWGGCGGNENRYKTQDLCEKACKIGNPAPPARPVDCASDPDVGEGKGQAHNFYYDVQIGKCLAFKFNGAKGNNNRFTSLARCNQACGSTHWTAPAPGTSDCTSLPQAGSGPAWFTRWNYVPAFGACQEFKYQGTGGNRNRYSTLEFCQDVCKSASTLGKPGNPALDCKSEYDEGTDGGVKVTTYWYDVESNGCLQFTYKGNGGNGNRYPNKEICQQLCGQTGPTTPRTGTVPMLRNH